VKDGYPKLLVLDSTHPDQILELERSIDLTKTLFIVSSKSGTTLEPNCYLDYFWDKLGSKVSDQSPVADRRLQFAVITDPGTPLEKLCDERGFRKLFSNPPDIGGRYSVLSYFGMVPAALMGIDIEYVLSLASSEAGLSRSEDERNTPLALGIFIGKAAERWRNHLTIVTPPELRSFGYWAEQLIAESTGKLGKGILPIEGESAEAMNEARNHRIYAHLTIGDQVISDDERLHPDHIELHLADKSAICAQFFRWEFATAVAGSIIGINPFDEPNVAEAKAKTNEVLADPNFAASGNEQSAAPDSQSLDKFLSENVKPDGYIAVMAYVNRNADSISALDKLRNKLSLKYHVPVTVGFGPRFLHSTGQLHKGGPSNGTFIQFTDKPKEDIPIPGKPFTFGTLIRAQAIGDFETLKKHDRPVVSYSLGSDPIAKLAELM
jgi:glucose-6-phosphate isomerase/transaldolase/glucose-6-phosphate isomerase